MEKEVKYKLTRIGKQELEAELKDLVEVQRPANVQAIAEARGQGDLSENADYAAAREEQGRIEGRIKEITEILKHIEIIEIKRVTVEYVDMKMKREFQIVGTIEADPFAGKISNDSPLGKVVLAHNPGETFYITTENGKEVKVKLISKVEE